MDGRWLHFGREACVVRDTAAIDFPVYFVCFAIPLVVVVVVAQRVLCHLWKVERKRRWHRGFVPKYATVIGVWPPRGWIIPSVLRNTEQLQEPRKLATPHGSGVKKRATLHGSSTTEDGSKLNPALHRIPASQPSTMFINGPVSPSDVHTNQRVIGRCKCVPLKGIRDSFRNGRIPVLGPPQDELPQHRETDQLLHSAQRHRHNAAHRCSTCKRPKMRLASVSWDSFRWKFRNRFSHACMLHTLLPHVRCAAQIPPPRAVCCTDSSSTCRFAKSRPSVCTTRNVCSMDGLFRGAIGRKVRRAGEG